MHKTLRLRAELSLTSLSVAKLDGVVPDEFWLVFSDTLAASDLVQFAATTTTLEDQCEAELHAA